MAIMKSSNKKSEDKSITLANETECDKDSKKVKVTSREFLEIPDSKLPRHELFISKALLEDKTDHKQNKKVQRKDADSYSSTVLKTFSIGQSNLLHTLQNFLPAMKQANEKLELDINANPESLRIEMDENYDGAHIQMDLALGVTELLTEEAVLAAENAVNGQCCTITQSNESSNPEKDEDEDDEGEGEETSGDLGRDTICISNLKTRKRPRIQEL